MGGIDVRRVLFSIVVLVVAALWIAEDAGWINMVGADNYQDEDLPAPAAEAMGLVAKGVILGNAATPGMVILSDNGRPPEMVSEGQAYHDDLRIERVLADRVILRQRDSNAPIVLAVVQQAAPGASGASGASAPADGAASQVAPPEQAGSKTAAPR
ncbi:hypothetical protein [Zoogloea sp.]|uniref:hypothetical protein n=1 Tax=Zoogloea sp. TaxID=49181 RepID=UPI0035ADF7F4